MTSPPPPPPPPPARRSIIRDAARLLRALGAMRLFVQVGGVLVALGLLAWCLSLALREENRGALERLRDAPGEWLVTLVALSLASLALNGLGFTLTLRRVARVRALDVQATNAVATALGYLPFKLSMIARVVYHHRRDGVPLMTIGGWLGANAALILIVLLPLAGAGVWRAGLDGPYVAAAAGGISLLAGAAYAFARLFGGPAGLDRLRALARRLGIGLADRLMARPSFRNLHAGLGILGHAPTVACVLGVRLADILVQSLRFVVVGRALEMPLPAEKAVLAASTFFLTGAASPAGSLGAREGVTTGVGALVQIPGVPYDALSVITLAVSAAEIVVYVPVAALAFLYLRLRPGPAAATPGRPGTPPARPYDPPHATGADPAQPDRRRP